MRFALVAIANKGPQELILGEDPLVLVLIEIAELLVFPHGRCHYYVDCFNRVAVSRFVFFNACNSLLDSPLLNSLLRQLAFLSKSHINFEEIYLASPFLFPHIVLRHSISNNLAFGHLLGAMSITQSDTKSLAQMRLEIPVLRMIFLAY